MKSDYDFRALNPVDYELEIVLPGIDNRMMKLVFDKTVKIIKKKMTEKDPTAKIPSWDSIERFDIPEEHMDKYRKLLLTCVQKQLLDIKEQIGRDGVSMVTHDAKKCTFEKNSKHSWSVRVIIGGQYAQVVRKRLVKPLPKW